MQNGGKEAVVGEDTPGLEADSTGGLEGMVE